MKIREIIGYGTAFLGPEIDHDQVEPGKLYLVSGDGDSAQAIVKQADGRVDTIAYGANIHALLAAIGELSSDMIERHIEIEVRRRLKAAMALLGGE